MIVEKTLSTAADKMRGAMYAGEYKHLALGLLVLRYVSISFQRLHDRLTADPTPTPRIATNTLPRRCFGCKKRPAGRTSPLMRNPQC